MPSGRRTGGWAVPLLMSLAFGCAPHVYNLAVSPRKICVGDSAEVSWRVRGQPSLTIQLDDPRLGIPPDEEHVVDAGAPDTIRLTMVATRGQKQASLHKEIQQFPAVFSRPIEFETKLDGSLLVASGTVDPENWDGRFLVRSIASRSRRALHVAHSGRTVDLKADGSPLTLPEPWPLSGDWEFSVALSPSDLADRSTLPTSLALTARISCGH